MKGSRRLLVVDDSPTVRKLVELTFRGTGWDVLCASNGTEGLLLARQGPPDVILLDFMLPDMRGIDVCEQLAADARTAGIPIVVLSGQESRVRELFVGYRSFHSCIGKSSSSDAIRGEVESAAIGSDASLRTEPARSSIKQKEAAAKGLYPILRDALANIPGWMRELGDAAPAPFFARKLLTPDMMGRLVDALTPHARTASPDAAAPPEPPTAALPTDVSFQGLMNGWSVGALVTFFEASGRNGELTLAHGDKITITYFRGGEVVALTCRDPIEYLRGISTSATRIEGVPREALEAAQAEQRRSGVPVFVTLAGVGYFPLSRLTEALRIQGRRLLLSATEVQASSFSWRDLPVLPAYVDAHGRHISAARNTLAFGADAGPQTPAPPSLQQATLERLRQSPSPQSADPGAIFSRSRGFSERLRQFTLTPDERCVLALVDGTSTASEIASHAELDAPEVLAILGRMTDVQLLRLDDGTTGVRNVQRLDRAGAARSLMILEPDVEGFQVPLASLLRNRPQPIALVDLAGEDDLVGAIQRERPQAVLLSAGAGVPIDDAARRLRSNTLLADVALVALLDPHMAMRASELTAAGFDAVLVKPVAYAELERLLH